MKTAQELFEQLNSTDENVRIEAKKASEIDKGIMETVCAFANEPNLGGGYLLLGAVRTDFRDGLPVYEPENIDNPDKVQNDLISKCSSMLNMHIRPQVEAEVVDGKTVIVVKIDELPDSQKPVFFLNRGLPSGAYRRVGASDQKCTEDDMRVFYSSAESFDSTVVKGATLDDIDENAVAHYRKLRARVNPNAEELSYDDKDLLLALRACEKEKSGEYVLTYTGLVVFGKSMSLRRLLPALRVDYIRVPGNRWIEDPDKRFEATIDMRGPLILLVNRALNAVKDDLPKGFELPKGKLQANTPIDLPDDVLREVLVNAFIHCSFRLNQPIQIIRYSNRLEVINPGFSLKSPETLGEPGSVQRNPFISTIFHDTNLAETKGSGIRSMRGHMKKAGLMPPTFESNRSANQFTARLLLHHLLDKETLQWLAFYANYSLNNEQRLALVFVREVGAIDNITYRQLNSDINNQRASYDLHYMCTKGLLEQKGQSRSTYYIPGENFINNSRLDGENSRGDGIENSRANGEKSNAAGEMCRANEEMCRANEEMCRGDGIENSRANGENSRGDRENGNAAGEMCRANEEMCRANGEMCRAEDLPNELRKRIGETGKRMAAKDMESLIIDLCTYRPLSLTEMASLLHRDVQALRYHYINTLIKQNKLFYTIPEMLNHPNQKYTAVKNK
ncbi:MAG: putative DNA binding domain-containing protein [Bacteroidales bacterium]|nr:putative DNA binding domain-containing protein [Bacteroidales bacterium]